MAKAPDDRLIGKLFGSTYRVDSLLGTGGMGAVYLATNVRVNKHFAIKTLTGQNEDSSLLRRFRREAEVTTKLGNPHIIEVQDFNQTDEGVQYMVMELLQGEDLQAVLDRETKLEPKRVLRIARQICWALSAAHAEGVVHRDLKPSNIFLCRDGPFADFVKVLDFGISKVLDSGSLVTSEDALIGTPYFMAPEQADSLIGEIGPGADIFALGSLLYRMLSGQFPFGGKTLARVLYQIVHGREQPLAELCPELEPALVSVVERAMRKHPSERFASIDGMSRALAQAMPEALVTGPPEASWMRSASAGDGKGDDPALAATGQARFQPSVSTLSGAATETPNAPGRSTSRLPRVLFVALLATGAAAVVAFFALRDPGAGPGPAGARPSRAAAHAPSATAATARDAAAPPAPPASTATGSAGAAPVRVADDTAASRSDAAVAAQAVVTVRGSPRGARVETADGELVGRLPKARFSLPRGDGKVVLRIRRRGYVTRRVPVVPGKDRVDLRVRLRRKRKAKRKPTSAMPSSPFHP